MENIFRELNVLKEIKFEIIGKDHQILQIVLMPNEKVVTTNGSILYYSPNLKSIEKKLHPSLQERVK